MKDTSIDDLLGQLRQEGTVESQGRFTLSGEKLREKLAAFQFERQSQWVLKVIQALVLAKVESCNIQQSHQRTTFVIKSSESPFPQEMLEKAFFDPEAETNPVVGHLVMALWFLSFNLQLAWVWKPRSSKIGLIWTGTDLRSIEIGRFDVSMLEISHVERKSENNWWSQMLSIAPSLGPTRCAEIAQELTRSAYTCPFPLRLDGLRLDDLLLCSSIREARYTTQLVPIAALGWGKADAVEVQLPPGTLRSSGQSTFVEKVVSREPSSHIAWMALLLANLRYVEHGKSSSWQSFSAPSRATWIRHGVVVWERDLQTSSAARCHLFVSADDLKLDISGLKPIWEKEHLEPSIRSGVLEWLNRQTISFAPRHHSRQMNVKVASNVIGIGGFFVAVCSGSILAFLPAAGAALALRAFGSAVDDSEELERKFDTELLALRRQWK